MKPWNMKLTSKQSYVFSMLKHQLENQLKSEINLCMYSAQYLLAHWTRS